MRLVDKANLEGRYKALVNELSEFKTSYAKLDAEKHRVDKELADHQAIHAQILKVAKEECAAWKVRWNKCDEERIALRQKNSDLGKQYDNAWARSKELLDEIKEAKFKITQKEDINMEREAEINQTQIELNEARSCIQRFLEYRNRVEGEKASLIRELVISEAEYQQLSERHSSVNEEMDELRKKLVEAHAKNNRLSQEIAELRSGRTAANNLEEAYAAIYNEAKMLREENVQLQKDVIAANAERSSAVTARARMSVQLDEIMSRLRESAIPGTQLRTQLHSSVTDLMKEMARMNATITLTANRVMNLLKLVEEVGHA